MKITRKIIAVAVAVIMLSGLLCFDAVAQSNTFEVRMMNYNVAGLPKFDGTDAAANNKAIADYITENGFDIVAVQEDFAYNKNLVSNLNGFDYFTNHSGSIPGGDGLNIFSDGMALYNEKRCEWKDAFGDIAEGDILTPKGLLYTVIEVSDGVYVDFYNIHADAFDTQGSVLARKSNYNQVADMIEENYQKNNRPVIVTGDFNSFLHTNSDVNSNMYEIFHERCGLKDAWVEIHNEGDYHDFSEWEQTGESYWGVWDSVEKFLYKDGGGVTVNPVEFKYTWIKNSAGEDVSDHAAAECSFEFTVTEDFVENSQNLEVVKVPFFRNFLNTIKWIFKDLIYIFSNIDELIEFIG